MRNPTYLIRSRHHTFYFRYPLPDALRCSGRTPYVKLSLGTCEAKQARHLSSLLEYHATQAAHHPQMHTLPHGEAITMLRHYLIQVLRHTQSEAVISQPTLQHKVQQIGIMPTLALSMKHAEISLRTVIESYMAEMMKSGVWGKRAVGQVEDCFSVLTDCIGNDYSVSSVGFAQARQVKELLTQLPANRNKKRETRDLPITEQIRIEGVSRLSIASINKHLITYSGLFKWAKKHGYTADNPFAEMLLKETITQKRQYSRYLLAPYA